MARRSSTRSGRSDTERASAGRPDHPTRRIQDELGRLRAIVRRYEAQGHTVTVMAGTRPGEIWQELTEANLPYAEWVRLEAIALRIERKTAGERMEQPMPLDRVDDGIAKVARMANA